MKIIGKSILLRQVEKEDLASIHDMSTSYKDLSGYFTTYVRARSYWIKRFEQTGLWDDNYGMLAICDKDSSEILGIIYYFKHSYVTGYEISVTILNQNIRGKNIITEAVRIFSAYLFCTYNIPRIQFNTLVDIKKNNGHIKYASDIGYTYEGTMRKAQFVRGQLVDLQLFSTLREEYPTLNEILKDYGV